MEQQGQGQQGDSLAVKTQILGYLVWALAALCLLLAGSLLYILNDRNRISSELVHSQAKLDAQKLLVVRFEANQSSYNEAIRKEGQLQAISRHKDTMTAIRAFSTAIESYAVDTNLYPDPRKTKELLQPMYIRNLPQYDGWKNPLRYTLKGRPDSPDYLYAISSPGQDGLYETKDDYLCSNGQFEKWPETGDLQPDKLVLPGERNSDIEAVKAPTPSKEN